MMPIAVQDSVGYSWTVALLYYWVLLAMVPPPPPSRTPQTPRAPGAFRPPPPRGFALVSP